MACGYERVDQVEERGQFAIRGDILDVYPATEERAVRCELFDIEVERLTWFSTFTQRSLEEAERVEIAPAAELAPEHRELAEIAAASDESERPDVADVLPVDRFCELLELVPEDALVTVAAEEELAPALRDYWEDVTASFHDDDAHHLYLKPERLDEALAARAALRLSAISQDQPHEFRAQAADSAAAAARRRTGAREAGALGLPHLRRLGPEGRGRTSPFEPGPGAGRLPGRQGRAGGGRCDLRPRQPSRRLCRALAEAGDPARAPPAARRRAERPTGPAPGAITSFTELRAGSPVVHEDHGIALFAGFETKTVAGVTRDYLELEFKDGDRVFVPSDQLHKISRYVGAEAGDPPLSKLGGKQWEQMKMRARRAAQALAGELLNLYAERRRRAGHAFAPDSDWQLEFEERFPYRETPDQLDAIEAVRADMEEARPMDRLICGDVGYGKTEVALRAAFKAAEDGKQVMFLVPTTVLAQQHFGTFSERMRDYPLRIEMVSASARPR